jgi:hypothetical protein
MAQNIKKISPAVSPLATGVNQLKGQIGNVSFVRGTSAAMTAGSVTISSVPVSSGSTNVQLTFNTAGGTQGFLKCTTRTAGAAGSFVIASSSGTDTSTVDYVLTNIWPHCDSSSVTITSANASDLATSLTLVNEIKAVYGLHIAEAGSGRAHLAADTTNTISSAWPVTALAAAITLANELKADYNAHRSQSGVHHVSDGGNSISSSDATDQSSLNTLLNELKTDINAHIAAAPTSDMEAFDIIDG